MSPDTTAPVAPPNAVSRHASWLELFYDLLFVALVSVIARGLLADPSLPTTGEALALLVPVWWVWVSNTFSINLFGDSDGLRRFAVLGTMASLLVVAAGVASALDGDPALYAAGFAGTRVVLLVYVVVWQRQNPDADPPTNSYVVYPISIVLWSVSMLAGSPGAYLLWAASIAVEVVVRIREQAPSRQPDGVAHFDFDHLVERFGQFVILSLGEGVIQITTTLAGTEPSAAVVVSGLDAFGIVAVMWWIYFDHTAPALSKAIEERPHRLPIPTTPPPPQTASAGADTIFCWRSLLPISTRRSPSSPRWPRSRRRRRPTRSRRPRPRAWCLR